MEKPFPAYRGSEPYVFVCYAHEDDGAVYRELGWLHEQGARIWYDEGISPGEEWSQEIGQAIEKAEQVVFFVTPASVASRNCRNEVNFAQNHNVPIVAVHLSETTLPSGLELAISAAQAILKYELSESAYQTKLVEVFSTDTFKRSTSENSDVQKHSVSSTVGWSIGTLSLITLVVFLAWNLDFKTAESPSTFDRSIGVLIAKGTDPVLADNLEQDLVSYLSQYQELRFLAGDWTDQRLASNDNTPSYLVTGSAEIQKTGIRVRVNLVRNTDGRLVYPYNNLVSENADLSELASTISRFVRLQLVQDHQCEAARRKSRSQEAGEMACTAIKQQYLMNQGGGFDPQRLLSIAERTVELDPSLWEGHWVVALSKLLLAGEIGWQEASLDMHKALDNAVEIDPANPLLEWQRGTAFMFLDLNYERAEQQFVHAIKLDPIHPNERWFYSSLGKLALRRGNTLLAKQHYERAIRIYDSDARIYAEYTKVLNLLGEYNEAIQAVNIGIELTSSGLWYRLLTEARVDALVGLGRIDQAKEVLMAIQNSSVRQLMLVGERAKAEQAMLILEKSKNPPSLIMAEGYAALGDLDRAFDWLGPAIDERVFLDFLFPRLNVVFSEMRDDPRWEDEMHKLAKLETDVSNPTEQ